MLEIVKNGKNRKNGKICHFGLNKISKNVQNGAFFVKMDKNRPKPEKWTKITPKNIEFITS